VITTIVTRSSQVVQCSHDGTEMLYVSRGGNVFLIFFVVALLIVTLMTERVFYSAIFVPYDPETGSKTNKKGCCKSQP
jgi:succinate dehydrogenase hydrophobic anchor subunit